MKMKFNEKYKQIDKIGDGSMGSVYLVQKRVNTDSFKDSQSHEFYVAKHVSLNKIDISQARKELKILEKLKHMYIVRYYEDFEQDNQLILIMDFCEGKDLEFHIKEMKRKGKYFNQSVISTWIFQLILVVEYIHSSNIVHRDIKPQNIFVDKDMNLKIGDFGVSKLLDGTQNCQTLAGTPFYFSPQLSKDQKYTNKTDIWSLGCVIYQVCTLEKPFETKGGGILKLFNAIQNQQPKNIPSIYSSDLNKLIRKMLIKDPKKRPTARELLQDPILVQLMINYSSQVNLKEQIQKKPLSKPSLSESFIEGQSNCVNEKIVQFQQEIKSKIKQLKNKNVSENQIDEYYQQVQLKMKKLKEVVDTAFNQMKKRSQKPNQTFNNSKMTESKEKSNKTIRSNISDSDMTIQSVELQKSKPLKEKTQKNLQPKIIDFQESSSIDSVQSILLNSKQIQQAKQNVNTLLLANTLKSEFMQTVQRQQDFGLKQQTLTKIQEVSKQIEKNPRVLLDETYLSMTLSLSQDPAISLKANSIMKKKKNNCDQSYGSSENSLNFDLTKRDFESSLPSTRKNINEIAQEVQNQQEEQQYYEEDFQSYEEDKSIDIREQEKKTVKELFCSTLKNFSEKSQTNSSITPNYSVGAKKYGLSLSTIRQQSSEGGSTITHNDDVL